MKTSGQTSVQEAHSGPVVEILDALSRCVAVMPAAEARRQLLPHRTVAILLQDADERFYLRRRTLGRFGGTKHWDVSARGQVWAGESVRDAASRVLEEGLGIRAERLRLATVLSPVQEHGNELLHVCLGTRPSGSGSAGALEDIEEGTFFSADEVHYLIREFRELVAPRFMLLVEATDLLKRPGRRP